MELHLGEPFAWSTPDDAVRWAALALGLVIAFGWRRTNVRALLFVERSAPLAAAMLSAGYIAYYLRGGPRIIDATAYYLQGRALAHGQWALPTGEPELSVVGRFLLRTDWHGPAASVIFPPGWPAVLAVGFLLGAPLAVGPVIAAALCFATAKLTRLAVTELGQEALADRAGATASVMSVACATLRYQTADTMSHGWAALCFTVALGSGWLALRRASPRLAILAGFAAGWLFATRPTSALALALTAVTAGAFGWLPRSGGKPLVRLGFGVLVGASLPASLWFFHQHAATGSWLGVAQHHYYAVSDGPIGCFRYGFGAGIGCIGEHGDFVRQHLPNGYGLAAALGTTGRRLLLHATDVLNFGPLALLVLLGARLKAPIARLLATAVLAQILVYTPFYFDGSYPGGGARMFADVLPIEHVLAALAVTTGFKRPSAADAVAAPKAAWHLRAKLTFTALLFGFSFGAGRDHRALRDREGGRPMFDESQLRRAGVDPTRTLVLIDTDHGFNLAHGPGRQVFRAHDDDLDRLTWETLGRPSTVRYAYRFRDGGADIAPVHFDPNPTRELPLHLEGESLWPPVAQSEGWAVPTWRVPACASRGRALNVTGGLTTAVLVRLPLAASERDLAPTITWTSASPGWGLDLLIDGAQAHSWPTQTLTKIAGCLTLSAMRVPKAQRSVELRLTGSDWALDTVQLSKIH